VGILAHGHPRANRTTGYVLEHVLDDRDHLRLAVCPPLAAAIIRANLSPSATQERAA
jgi:hypothetical protein